MTAFVRRQDLAADKSLLISLLSDSDSEKDIPFTEKRGSISWAQVLSSIVSLLQAVLVSLTPSFITAFFKPYSEPRRLHPTSFLDGLRGWASFVVAHVHLVAAYERWLLPSYGMGNDPIGSNIFQLPFIRVFFAARPMIHIFMVISGYVLSCKAIRLIRHGKYAEADEVVISMIFRRGIRLFLPSIIGIVIVEISAWLGWQNWHAQPTLWGKLGNIYLNVERLVYSWNWDYENDKQLLQLWTIPVEFACSMLLFLVIMGTSRLRPVVRLCIIAGLAIHCHACAHWCPFEFLAGMMIAEFQSMCEERETACLANGGASDGTILDDFLDRWGPRFAVAKKYQKALWITLFIFGLFLAGYPEEYAEIDWGFKVFYWLTPQIYIAHGAILTSFFWFGIGAICMVLSLFHLPFLRRLFESPISQYLGDVSYSVYIVHYCTVLALEKRIVYQAHVMVGGVDTQLKRIGAVVLEIVTLMTLVIWQADIFWRAVDKPVVVLARRVEKLCRGTDT